MAVTRRFTGKSGAERCAAEKEDVMAKTNPGEFVRQVRAEANKIVWPTPRETMVTAIMVLIMTTILAIFFLGVDGLFRFIVNWLLSFAG
jgi:preprotein translocase subunit SecE